MTKVEGIHYIHGQTPARPHQIGNQARPLRTRLQQASGKQQYAQHSQRYAPEKRGDIP